MWIELFEWVGYTVLIAVCFRLKGWWIARNSRYSVQKRFMNRMRQTHIKTLNEQKSFVRNQSAMGEDLLTIVFSSLIFLSGFYILIYPKIPSLYIGEWIVIGYALLYAFIIAYFIKPKQYFRYNFVDALLSGLYGGALLLEIRFVHPINNLLLIAISVVLMIGLGRILNMEWSKKIFVDKI